MGLAHERKRHCLNLLLKKLKFSPIVSIQGPRQSGKSYFAKNLISKSVKNTEYLTLDHKDIRSFAEDNPMTFLTANRSHPLIIDEVQKVPHLFDELKAIVDAKRRPGEYIILGSTEFSHETQIKESLTGRLSRIRLFPFNLAETQKLEINPQTKPPFINPKPRVLRSDLLKYLEIGGFPGIFIIKNEEERHVMIDDWLKLTVERDIHQIKKYKLDSDLASKILILIATLEKPTLSHISTELRVNARRVLNHINSLKALFVIFEVSPLRGSAGKTMYFIVDPAILSYYRATFDKKLTTWFYLEILSQFSYKGFSFPRLQFYKSATSRSIHLAIEMEKVLYGIKVVFSESIDKRDYLIFESFKKKYAKNYQDIRSYILYGGQNRVKVDDVNYAPWESIV